MMTMTIRYPLFVVAALAVGCDATEGPRNNDNSGGEASSTGANNSVGGGGANGGSSSTNGGGGMTPSGEGISADHPNDVGIQNHPSVIFHSNFEDGFAGFTSYTQNPARLDVDDDASLANGGNRFMRATITRTDLESQANLSAQARVEFPPVDEIYWRFYARFVGDTAPPHHWVRTIALSDSYSADGHAGYAPGGGDGFWFDFDVKIDDTFSFYTYWHEMRSWMCNDGSTDPGCAGYNGPSNSPHYGNNFHAANQTSFPRDQWFCLELHGKANTPGADDGELSFWLNGEPVEHYRNGAPNGRWLRQNFYTHGTYFEDEGPFEGFNFRTDGDVGWRLVVMDMYFQKNTLDQKEDNGYPVPEAQIILYDDVVIATERIGCKAPE